MKSDSWAGQPAGGQVAFEWRLDPETDESQAEQLAEALRRGGGEAHLRPRPTGVLVVAVPLAVFGVVAGVALVEQIIDWWRDRKRTGLLIHVGKDRKVDIRPLDIPYGQVLFVGADGKTMQYVNVSEERMKHLMEAATHGITPPGGTEVPS